MPSPKHPVRVLVQLLDARGRRRVAFVSLTLLVERLTLTASAVLLSSRGLDATLLAVVALASVFLLRSAARSLLSLHVRGQVVEALATALLSTNPDAGSADAELPMVDAMYATEEVLRQRLPDLLGDAPACAILSVFVVFREPWPLVLLGAAVILVGGIVAALVRDLIGSHFQRAWRAFLPALDDLMTAIHARAEVVGNGDEGRLLAGLARKLDAWKAHSRRASIVSFLAGRAPVVAAAVVVGAALLEKGAWSGLSWSWLAVLASVVPPFAGVARGSLDIGRDLVRAKPVLDALEPSPGANRGGETVVALPADVVFDDVTFAYRGAPTESVRSLDVVWTPGTLLGVAGQNGSGKSTFARLLLGLLTPTGGEIRVGGVAQKDANMAELRNRIGYLAQTPYLAERATILDVIRERAPDATVDVIQRLLRRLGLFAVLERRLKDAPLEVKVGALSVGERQRVALARVLLRDAGMLVLDEPDANLDAEGITVVGDLLQEEAKTRMVVVIAHSPALLARMDRVLRFEAGRIADE